MDNSSLTKTLKAWLPDVLAVVLFVALAFAYFYPADFEGRILYQHDTSAGVGAGQEAKEYLEKTGERTRWTNGLFSGMPTYQIAPSYDSTATISAVEKAYHLWLPDNVWYLFVYLLGFYILLRAFNFKQHLAALGSIVWAFSTYFLIIIAAGHLWKVMALAYLPPMIAGMVLAFRGKYLWGLLVTAIFAALEIHANHVQMTYYYMFIILFMLIAYGVEAIRQKRLAHLLKAFGVCVAGGLLGVLVNISNLYHTWEYSKESMRGGSEVAQTESNGMQTQDGLERSYITTYSYGIGETWSLMIPNVKGGSSSIALKSDERAAEILADHQVNFGEGQSMSCLDIINTIDSQYGMPEGSSVIGQYWEESMMPEGTGTSGPVYVGAFVLTLFVLGLLVVKGPMKWALLAATILSILLAWGKNFMGFTDFFIDHVPMYAKFRTVESILVIAEFTIPLLAMMALKKVIEEPDVIGRKNIWKLYAAFGVTGGICLLFALFPSLFFNFTTTGEAESYSKMLGEGGAPSMLAGLDEARRSIFTADCWRSLLIIVIGTAAVMLYRARKLKAMPTVAVIAVVCLFDMWQVNKRYLNDAMFVDADVRQTSHEMTPADEQILKDQTLDYRVVNLYSNTFNENETSYYHKSIGGYHAAKLSRYQNMVEKYINKEMAVAKNVISNYTDTLMYVPGDSLWPVLNMLNTKYFIASPVKPVENPFRNGNAWFVNQVKYVDNAQQELEGLAETDLRHEAVADKQYQNVLGKGTVEPDSTASAQLLSYEPNQLKYSVNSAKGGVLVFSEIFYPGWEVTVDGQPAQLGRVNYVLRALRVAPGQHQVELSFFPKSVDRTETVAYVALVIMALLLVAVGYLEYRKRKATHGV